MQPTAEQWKRLEEELSFAYGRAELLVDGYAVSLEVKRIAPLRYAIAVFVNGWMRGEWLMNDCEERRRFYRPATVHLWSAARRKRMRRINKAAAAAIGLHEKGTYYQSAWPSFKTLRRHLVANNQSIRVTRIGIEDVPQ